MNAYINIQVTLPDHFDASVVVALLSEIGFTGFEENEDQLKCFIPSSDYSKEETEDVLDQLGLAYQTHDVIQENWNAIWESEYEPIEIDDFCRIRASFHPSKSGFQHELIITPKMSFGTGHHATTRMMIRLMKELKFQGKTVFDFGTGTGVLGILAAALGANHIYGNDIDEWCVDNARENIEANQIKSMVVDLSSLEDLKSEKFDIILANINLNILSASMEKLANLILPGGKLLVSGFYAKESNFMDQIAQHYNLAKSMQLVDTEWTAVMYDKN